jgi:hypothetical protein
MKQTVLILTTMGLILVATSSFNVALCDAADKQVKNKATQFQKPVTVGDYTKMEINNISAYIRNNGSFNRDPNTGNAGFEWPKGSGNTAVYASGLWLGAVDSVTDSVRVAVAEYSYEYTAGPIGVGVNPSDSRWKMYKISRGDNAGTNPDYANWPGEDGAPFIDKNGNGVWDRGIDEPELLGDQTVWCVFNDNDPAGHVNMLAPPLGVEVQLTAFAFDRSNALGNTIFYKWKLINKGGRTLKDSYVSIWADPDVGTATDDLDGCDTTLGLGYTYNGGAIDGVYGSAVPAVGFDFFQGPIVPSLYDTAIVSGVRVPGYKNLKMTSYLKYSNDASNLGNPWTGQECYNYMKSYDRNGVKITSPSGYPTDFMFPGDPTQAASSTNWIDTSPSDRRFMMSSGPFNMAPGDTQEIVAGNLIALGADYLGSVTALKQADMVAQTAYDLNFKLPSTPSSQEVSATGLDQKVILNWAENYTLADQIEATHTFDPLASASGDPTPYYDFEGYVVYQYSDIQGSNEKRVATFDVINNVKIIYDYIFDVNYGAYIYAPVKYGNDIGIERSILISKDIFTNLPLQNNTDYYFAVTSYTYNVESAPKTLESSKKIFAIKPQAISWHLPVAYGDTLKEVFHSSGKSDGSVIPIVIDPLKLTGHNYGVTFTESLGEITWNLTDSTLGKLLISAQRNQSGDGKYPIADGIMVKVIGPPPGMKEWSIPSGTRRFSSVGGFFGLGLEGFSTSTDPTAYDVDNGTIGMAGHFAFGGIGTTLISTQYHNVLLKLAVVDPEILWDPLVAPADTNFSRSYRWLRSSSATPPDSSFIPWIIHTGSGYQYQAFDYGVPFSAWDMETDPPTRLAVGHFENNVTNGLVDGRYWPGDASTGDNTVAREFCFIFNEPYSTTPNPAFQTNLSNNASLPMMWVMTCSRRNANPWVAGDEFLILANHISGPQDVWNFNSITLGVDEENLISDYRLNQNYPNPFNPSTSIKYQLPSHSKVNLKIYNLLGQEVKTLTDEIQPIGFKQVEWNSTNNSGAVVASGVYFYRLEATSVAEPSKTFIQVKKMILLK